MSDVDGTLAWLERYFGTLGVDADPARTAGDARSASVRAEPAVLEIRGHAAPGRSRILPSFQRIGSWHLCLDVPDPAALHADMAAAGEEIVLPLSAPDRGLYRGRSHFFSRDPDGVLVQVRALA